MTEVNAKNNKFAFRFAGSVLNCVYVSTLSLAEKAIARLIERSESVLGFDIETGRKTNYLNDEMAGLCPYRSFVSLLQFYDGIDTCYMFDTFYLPLDIFKPIFAAKRVIAHNALFDVQHMTHAGFKDIKADCSMIMYNLVRCAEFASIEEETQALEDELDAKEGEGQVVDHLQWLTKSERYGATLRAVSAKILGIRVEKELQTSNWTDRPLSEDQLVYAAKDCWLTFQVGRVLAKKIEELGLTKCYALNRAAIHPVVQMTLNGSDIDVDKHRADIDRWIREKDALHVSILRLFGSDTNIRSVHDISRWLERSLPLAVQHQWPRSEKTGKLRSDAKSLSKYAHLEFVKPLLEYKKLDKLLSTYGQAIIDKVNPETKRLHGSFTLGYTATGRLSSRNPNLQNLPRDSDIRSIFRASKGRVLVCADYGQIELRVAAELSRDPVMLEAYKNGDDLHALTASKITGRSMDSVSKSDRQLAKSLNFGLLFGLGAKGLVDYAAWNYKVKLTEEEAYSHYKTFFDTYAGYAAWQKKRREECEKTGIAYTVMGKTRRLQELGRYTRSVNHPVQGSAAEVVILALNNLYKALRNRRDILIVNCVHDEILLEAVEAVKEEAKDILQDCMTRAMLKVFPKATTNKLVDAKIGLTWASAKG